MSGVPTVSEASYRRWPEILKNAGYEVEVDEHDEELSCGTVGKDGRKISVALLRHTDGTAALFFKGTRLFRPEWRLSRDIAAVLSEDADRSLEFPSAQAGAGAGGKRSEDDS